ncbi:MAG: HAMP domain-containing protein [Candidatus Hydrogenedentes bacterium]|nr:HAMP domain-containing protein [Candidatus Hydrogenedentota bacterium]
MMRLHSFRVRVALLSVLLSGLVLALFGWWAWRTLYRTALEQIDGTLEDIAQLHLSMRRDPQHWPALERSLQDIFGTEGGGVVIRVADADGHLMHQSPQWPFGPNAALPEPGEMVAPPPEGPPWGGPPRHGRPPDEIPRGPGPPFGRRGPNGGGGGWFRFEHGPGPEGDDFPPPPPGGFPPGPPPGDAMPPPRPPESGEDSASTDSAFPPPPRRGEGAGGFSMRFRGGDGGVVGWGGRDFGPPPPLRLRTGNLRTVFADGAAWRVGGFGNEDVTMQVAVSLRSFSAEVGGARDAFLLALPVALLAIAAGSWFLATRALRPVTRVTRAIANVSAKGLDQRVGVRGEDHEFEQLIAMFNGMMERLERSFQQALRFSSDAAHELKTPLTILQGELEQAVQHGTPEQRATLGKLIEEVQRLKAIVQKLLLLALADAGRLTVHREPAPLSEMIEEMVEDARILAPKLHIDHRIQPEVQVMADKDLLRQAIQNVVTNALKYTPENGGVRVLLAQKNGRVRCTVQNTGDIPAEDRPHVFERFYRVDKARTREAEGTGLGLSLAREIARAHGGDLRLDDTPPGHVSFTLEVPAE